MLKILYPYTVKKLSNIPYQWKKPENHTKKPPLFYNFAFHLLSNWGGEELLWVTLMEKQ